MGHRDCMMPLDETADGEHKMPLDQKARMLTFVIARNRPRKYSKKYEKQHGLQNREYRIVVQSSSERALRDIARNAGNQRLGGEEVRFTDVPASEPGSQESLTVRSSLLMARRCQRSQRDGSKTIPPPHNDIKAMSCERFSTSLRKTRIGRQRFGSKCDSLKPSHRRTI